MKRLLCLLLAAALVSCDKSDDVIADFEDAGWTVRVLDLEEEGDLALLKSLLTEKDIATIPECDIIIAFKASIPLACILSFDSRVDLRHYLETLSEEKQEAASAEGRIRGNCYLRYAGGHGKGSALDIYAED